ncbi:MAG: polysaccharide deacetylase family protein [Bdellovibrionota bacterium]|nr:polysaccharide deacetylase family protein [Bdellovibrionota bacterium]
MANFLKIIFLCSISLQLNAKSLHDFIQSINQSTSLEDYGSKVQNLKEALESKKLILSLDECEQLETQSFESIGSIYSISLEHPELFPAKCIDQLSLKAALIRQHFSSFKENRIAISPVHVDADLLNEYSLNYRKGPVLIDGGLAKGFIALTFDDGPHQVFTKEIFEILQAEEIRATFFSVGKNLEKYPHIVRLGIDNGHSYGSHSYDHSNLPKLSLRKAKTNIQKGIEVLENLSNQSHPFFRFPYGSKNSRLKNYVKNYPLADFYWSLDSEDWKIRNPEELYSSVVKKINQKQSGIILFHDIQPQTRAILPSLVKNLKKAGYKFVIFKK